MAQCSLCNTKSRYISENIGICIKCIRNSPENALNIVMEVHKSSRKAFGLPAAPPKEQDGLKCNICVNECMIPENESGYCGIRENRNDKFSGVSSEKGNLSWYFDPLPTNCVADWVCAGGTEAGYPDYSYNKGPEIGYKNLAVFFQSCSFNCLYCQNWHFRKDTLRSPLKPVDSLVNDVDKKTSCICYFGGDPTTQLPFALKASKLAIAKSKDRILRICWETNGSMNRALLKQMIKLSIESGGCIKFDLKAWDENLHKVLTGMTNKRTLENFKIVSEFIKTRPVPPLLIASTLIVPGYIDEKEIRDIACFISSINPDIPYSLLAFYPHFYMSDIPITSKGIAEKCQNAARDEGLKNVRIGNINLLV